MAVHNDEEPAWAGMNDLYICHRHGACASITAATTSSSVRREGKQNRPDCVGRDASRHVTRCIWARSTDTTEPRAFPTTAPPNTCPDSGVVRPRGLLAAWAGPKWRISIRKYDGMVHTKSGWWISNGLNIWDNGYAFLNWLSMIVFHWKEIECTVYLCLK